MVALQHMQSAMHNNNWLDLSEEAESHLTCLLIPMRPFQNICISSASLE